MSALRRLVPALVAACLLAVGAVGCQWPDGTRYVDRVFTSHTSQLGLDYRTTTNSSGETVTLKMDVFSPPASDTATNRPAVIWSFGGAWLVGDRSQLRSYAQDSARRGYVGITIDYRTRPAPGPVLDMAGDAYDDTLAAVDYVKAHAAEWGVNPDAIVVGGYSAGGINSANVAYWPGERGPATSPVAGAVSIAGFTFGAPAQGEPPILMFHGDNDNIVPYGTGQNTCTSAKEAGVGCRFYTYAGAGHEIGGTKATEIMERTADWIFEVVLYPKGYRP